MIRSSKMFARFAALAIAAGLALPVAAEAQHKWKVQNLYGPSTTVYKDFQAFRGALKGKFKGHDPSMRQPAKGCNWLRFCQGDVF